MAVWARGLRRTFRGRGGDVVALDGLDLRVGPGEVFGLLGPNGAGKSTALRLLATLLAPSGGEATVAGHDLRREPRRVRERIGYVAQGGGTDPAVTGRAELLLQARLYGIPRGAAVARAAALIERFELGPCADRPCGTYSGGQRRRLDLALGLVHHPRVLFLDEPSTGLDPQARARVWDEVRRLRREGTAVLLTTHYLEEADALCDRLAIVDHGRVVAGGTADELKRGVAGSVIRLRLEGAGGGAPGGDVGGDVGGDPAGRAAGLLGGQPFVRRVEPDGGEAGALRLYVERGETALPAVLRLLDGAGLAPAAVSLSRPTLDDVFLQHTGRALGEARP